MGQAANCESLLGDIPGPIGALDATEIAVKEFRVDEVITTLDPPGILAEVKAWDIYQKASLEARVMVQLQHPHVLGLIGLTLQPLRLLVELAPVGDLKSCAKRFRGADVRLNRKTIKTTLIQVCIVCTYMRIHQHVFCCCCCCCCCCAFSHLVCHSLP